MKMYYAIYCAIMLDILLDILKQWFRSSLLNIVMFMSDLWFYKVNISENRFCNDAIIMKNSFKLIIYIMANILTVGFHWLVKV